jgi:hypothetical protein
MAGPEHEIASGDDRGRLAAADADRESVIGKLTAAYVYGLVTKDEFDTRVGQTFAARTYAELAMVTGDIPAGLAPAPPPLRPAPAQASPLVAANVPAGDRAIMATAMVAGLALAASAFAGPLAGLLVLAGAGSAFVSLFLLRMQTHSRRAERPGGQLPTQRGAGPGVSASDRPISATSAERFPHAAKPRRSHANAARRHSARPQLSSRPCVQR